MNKLTIFKINKIGSLLIIFTIGLYTVSQAAELAVGTLSCKEWIEDRSTDSNYINKSVDQSWVLGFLSSYSVTTRIDFLANIQTSAIFAWMDKYCSMNPKRNIDEASLLLAHKLTEKMKNPPPSK